MLTLLIAATVTYVLTPLVRRAAIRFGVVKAASDRDVHAAPIPRMGGIAMYAGVAAALLVASRLFPLSDTFHGTGLVEGLLGAGGLIVIIGVIDDRWGVGAIGKLVGQIAAAGILFASGARLTYFPAPHDGLFSLTQNESIVLTILIVVATINAINFIDGLDGLAAGIVFIAAISFFIYYYWLTKILGLSAEAVPALAAIVLAGACLGFLPHNFYPARIFMGDSGALVLGFVLAAISVQGLLKTAATVALFFPLLVLAVPIVDTTFVVVRRLKHGERVFEADQAHLHHRFLRRGFSQRRAALTIWAWCMSLAAAAFATRFVPFRAHGVWHPWWTVLAVVIGLVAVLFSVYVVYVLEIVKLGNRIQRRRKRDDPLKKIA